MYFQVKWLLFKKVFLVTCFTINRRALLHLSNKYVAPRCRLKVKSVHSWARTGSSRVLQIGINEGGKGSHSIPHPSTAIWCYYRNKRRKLKQRFQILFIAAEVKDLVCDPGE